MDSISKITGLSQQKRNPRRVNVYLDGEYAFGLPDIIAARLVVGQALSAAEIEALKVQDQFEVVKEKAVRLIMMRPRSATEIRRKLAQKGYDEALIEEVLDHLEETQLLDDEAFAAYWVEQRSDFRPRSQMALRQELQQKGVGRQTIDSALTGFDETEAARSAALKKARQLAHLPEREFRIKLGRFLQQRGFQFDIIKEITQEAWLSAQAESGE
jgi:regulatory protein